MEGWDNLGEKSQIMMVFKRKQIFIFNEKRTTLTKVCLKYERTDLCVRCMALMWLILLCMSRDTVSFRLKKLPSRVSWSCKMGQTILIKKIATYVTFYSMISFADLANIFYPLFLLELKKMQICKNASYSFHLNKTPRPALLISGNLSICNRGRLQPSIFVAVWYDPFLLVCIFIIDILCTFDLLVHLLITWLLPFLPFNHSQ